MWSFISLAAVRFLASEVLGREGGDFNEVSPGISHLLWGILPLGISRSPGSRDSFVDLYNTLPWSVSSWIDGREVLGPPCMQRIFLHMSPPRGWQGKVNVARQGGRHATAQADGLVLLRAVHLLPLFSSTLPGPYRVPIPKPLTSPIAPAEPPLRFLRTLSG